MFSEFGEFDDAHEIPRNHELDELRRLQDEQEGLRLPQEMEQLRQHNELHRQGLERARLADEARETTEKEIPKEVPKRVEGTTEIEETVRHTDIPPVIQRPDRKSVVEL